MVKRNKKELIALKKQIIELAVLGYSSLKIGQDLGIPERTISRWVQSHRIARAKEQEGKAEAIIGELIESQDKRTRYLQAIISEGTKSEKMKAMALLQTEDQMKIKRHQLAGNLPTEAPTIAIQNTNVVEGTTTISDMIRQKFPDMIERFSKIKAIEVKPKKEGR